MHVIVTSIFYQYLLNEYDFELIGTNSVDINKRLLKEVLTKISNCLESSVIGCVCKPFKETGNRVSENIFGCKFISQYLTYGNK